MPKWSTISVVDNIVVIGIDPASTKVAFVGMSLENNNQFVVKRHKKLGKSGGEACSNGRKVTLDFVNQLKDGFGPSKIFAFIESPIVGRGGVRTTMVQCFTSGAIQGALHEQRIPTQAVNVSSWKKQVVGYGRASKEDVAEHLRLRWNDIFTKAEGDQDIYDAACIALFGCKQLNDNTVV
jgi:Holliday junction resolvasome RuvABC endonuclease subunit